MCPDIVSWDRRFRQYKTYCGNPRCPNTDPEVTAIKKSKSDYEQQRLTRQQTNLRKYGHTNYLASSSGKIVASANRPNPTHQQRKSRKEHRENTIVSKYGVQNVGHLNYDPGVLDKLTDKGWLYTEHYTNKRTLTDIAQGLNVAGGATTIGQYLARVGLYTQTQSAQSTAEKEICNWVRSLVGSTNVLSGNRSTIDPYELDIYIPSHNLAIEYCGLYWHSEQQGKDRQYHRRKWQMCHERGIQLLTIYEDEWQARQEQVKRKILSLLGISNEPTIYARKCHVITLSTKQKRKFFEDNHIQGDGPGSITYGLTYDNEIVAAVAWIKQPNNIYCLNRYATSAHVPGGFSKLLKHFQSTHEWTQLVSFADLRWSNGNLYSSTGWTLDKTIPPDYYYSPDGHTRFHKFNYRRKNLPTVLKQFDPNLSETENCNNNGILRIWDCGKMRFVINK
jgi:hypothetical protein